MILILIAFAAMGITDPILDTPKSWLSAHVLLELSLVSLSIAAAIYLWLGWRRSADDLEDTRAELVVQNAAAAEWKAKAEVSLLGLGHAIDEQFTKSGLDGRAELAAFFLDGLRLPTRYSP